MARLQTSTLAESQVALRGFVMPREAGSCKTSSLQIRIRKNQIAACIQSIAHAIPVRSPRAGGAGLTGRNEFGRPSIRTKALSIHSCAVRCFSRRVVAREGGGPRLWKSHGESFPGETDRFTNHRSGRHIGHDSSIRIPICIGTRAPNHRVGLSVSQRTTRGTREPPGAPFDSSTGIILSPVDVTWCIISKAI
jgi:hypothetical protein